MSNLATETETPDEVEFSAEENEFLRKREAIADAIKDEEKMRQMLAEMYLFYSNMDTAMRAFSQNGGMRSILKGFMGLKGSGDEVN